MPADLTPVLARGRSRLSAIFHTDRVLLREFLAEFIGTAVLIIIGDGAVAQVVLSKGTNGDFFTINVAYALAIAFGVYICGGVSGGHINPAISLTMAVLGKLKWIKLPVYMLAQHLGALFGSAVIYAVYYEALTKYHDKGIGPFTTNPGNAGIFATYPQPWLSAGEGLFDQILGTALLAGLVLAICDYRNMEVPKYLIPLLVGLVVGAIGMAFGFNCGYAINPARDLGPRIFTAMAGWKGSPFSFRDGNWFWVPIVGPYIGALVGALGYLLFVGNHWPHTAVVVIEQKQNNANVEAALLQKEPPK